MALQRCPSGRGNPFAVHPLAGPILQQPSSLVASSADVVGAVCEDETHGVGFAHVASRSMRGWVTAAGIGGAPFWDRWESTTRTGAKGLSGPGGQHKSERMSSLAAVSVVPLPGCLLAWLRRPSQPTVRSPAMSKCRHSVKWTGVVVCVVIVVAWAASLRWMSRYTSGGWWMLSSSGRIAFVSSDMLTGDGWESLDQFSKGTQWEHQVPRFERTRQGTSYEIPHWLPFILVALPTTFMFYRDRKRIPPGHCKTCGYNLMGAEHERCPECGETCEDGA